MAGGGGGGGGDIIVPISPRAAQPIRGGRRRQKQAAACLPLDVIVDEIATRSDAATLVRCAATCREARRRIAEDPNLRARLRLRDTGRFLFPLLRGHLLGITRYEAGRGKITVNLVDTNAADPNRPIETTFAESETLRDAMLMDSRGGLVLVRATATSLLRVCNPVTRRCQDLPPEPAFPPHAGQINTRVRYVLLVGDGEGGAAVGQPFRVLKAKLVLPDGNRRMMAHTFSSEHGAWSPLTEIPTPDILGNNICWASPRKVLVVGDVVHWLCLTDSGSYVLMLHVRAARVNVTALPANFPRGDALGRRSYLLATDSAGGSPVVLVADAEDKNIRAWEQCTRTKTKMRWKARRQVVIESEAIMGFNNEVEKALLWHKDWMAKIYRMDEGTRRTTGLELLWFGERSGVVLLRIHGFFLLWLDLHSKKIFRCFSSELERRLYAARVNCPYETDLSSWVPTFSSVAVAI